MYSAAYIATRGISFWWSLLRSNSFNYSCQVLCQLVEKWYVQFVDNGFVFRDVMIDKKVNGSVSVISVTITLCQLYINNIIFMVNLTTTYSHKSSHDKFDDNIFPQLCFNKQFRRRSVWYESFAKEFLHFRRMLESVRLDFGFYQEG